MNVAKNIKILILAGGWSNERDISLTSGKSVYNALDNANYNVLFLDFHTNDKNLLESHIKKNKISLVFNLMHGEGGEDGLVQKFLDEIGVEYIGSGCRASQMSFDKVETKLKWMSVKLPTPLFSEFPSVTDEFIQGLVKCKKVVIKPKSSGSSVGIKLIRTDQLNLKNKSDFLNSVYEKYEKSIDINQYFIEHFVEGDEYTAPIIHNKVYPIIKIETSREFYDFAAKYEDSGTNFTFPEFDQNMLEIIQKTTLSAFESLGCNGWGRVDFFLDKELNINLIEVNSIPGMTNHSLVPMSAKKNGLTYLSLIEKLISKPHG